MGYNQCCGAVLRVCVGSRRDGDLKLEISENDIGISHICSRPRIAPSCSGQEIRTRRERLSLGTRDESVRNAWFCVLKARSHGVLFGLVCYVCWLSFFRNVLGT